MFKVTKITDGIMTSNGTTFIKDKEVSVSKEIKDYLEKTFPTAFSFESVEKEKSVEIKKSKVESKPKNKRTSKKEVTKDK